MRSLNDKIVMPLLERLVFLLLLAKGLSLVQDQVIDLVQLFLDFLLSDFDLCLDLLSAYLRSLAHCGRYR